MSILEKVEARKKAAEDELDRRYYDALTKWLFMSPEEAMRREIEMWMALVPINPTPISAEEGSWNAS